MKTDKIFQTVKYAIGFLLICSSISCNDSKSTTNATASNSITPNVSSSNSPKSSETPSFNNVNIQTVQQCLPNKKEYSLFQKLLSLPIVNSLMVEHPSIKYYILIAKDDQLIKNSIDDYILENKHEQLNDFMLGSIVMISRDAQISSGKSFSQKSFEFDFANNSVKSENGEFKILNQIDCKNFVELIFIDKYIF